MEVTAADLVDGGARHRWPDGAESELVVVRGPALLVGSEGLVWFDPFLTSDACAAPLEEGPHVTASSVVEWPPGPVRPQGARAGAAAVVGDPAAVVQWHRLLEPDGEPAEVGCSYGVVAVVVAESREQVADAVASHPWLEPVVGQVQAEHVAPLVIDGRVVGVAFDCGMGSSANLLWVGRAADGRAVAVVADLELLHEAASPA